MSDKPGDQGVNLRLDAKTVAAVLAFLIGGGAMGLGGSYAARPDEALHALEEEVSDSAKRIEQAARDIADVKAEVKADRRDILRLEQLIDKHELSSKDEHEAIKKRIRWLERRHGGPREDR